jgi:myo-inositol 2-dehydrogenase / D-chiro-inositol 1-dehydrogenase
MNPVRVGLIGCGWFAQAVHLPILTRLRQAQVVALAEADPERLRSAGRLAPAAVRYDNYHALLQEADIEATIICLPTSLHAEASIAAMRQGRHVYLEKPIATSLDEAGQIMKAWKEAEVVGMVGFNYRFNALHQAARMQIQAGRIGPLVGVRSVFSTPTRSMPAWKQTRSNGGGVLLDLASHHIDLVRFLFQQDVRMVYADIESRCTEHDTAMLHLRLADGLRVQSYFSLGAVDEDRFEIYGQAGKLTVDRYRSLDVEIVDAGGASSRLRRITRRLRSIRSVPYLFKKLQSPWHEPSYREALSRFVCATRGRDRASPDLLDGYRSLEVICAAEESAQTGRSVSPKSSAVDF